MPVYERAIELMEAELGDELVALDPDAGSCFGFNNVAASVWRTAPMHYSQLLLRGDAPFVVAEFVKIGQTLARRLRFRS